MTIRGKLARLAFLALALGACGDLERYEGSFSGQVVGGPRDQSFIRRGFPPDARLVLDFHPGAAATQPGTITTEGTDLFDHAALQPIAPLAHDLLSQYDFPEGRVASFIFTSLIDGGEFRGQWATVFVSLLQDGAIEVRVLYGRLSGSDTGQGETPPGFFGLFQLRKERAGEARGRPRGSE